MAKQKVTEIVSVELAPFLEQNGYELFHTEYVKEGKDWFLRIYIDKEEGISIEDCEKVTRFISERLDALDPIEKNYYLEVSSPGIDRPLLQDSDYEKYKGHRIDIMLYKSLNGSKMIQGELLGLKEGVITIKDEKGKEMEITKESVSKVKLAVIF